MEKTELTDLVKNSFLSEAEKKELLEYLETTGDDQAFYQKFNHYLIRAVEKRRDDYKEVIQYFDAATAALDGESQKKKEELKDDLNQKISRVNPADFSERKKIWDEYYVSLGKLREDYEKRIKDIATEAFKKMM